MRAPPKWIKNQLRNISEQPTWQTLELELHKPGRRIRRTGAGWAPEGRDRSRSRAPGIHRARNSGNERGTEGPTMDECRPWSSVNEISYGGR